MLKLINSMGALNAEQLMDVYLEGNRENGKCRFPNLSEEEQLRKAEDEFLSYLREDFFPMKGAFYAVWTVDGAYRAALRLEPYRDGMLLEALETAPDVRRKGYAFSLMTAVLTYLKASDCKAVYSHISKRNVPSLGAHYKCGFQKIADSATYIDGTVTRNSYTMCFYL